MFPSEIRVSTLRKDTDRIWWVVAVMYDGCTMDSGWEISPSLNLTLTLSLTLTLTLTLTPTLIVTLTIRAQPR